MRSKVKKLAVEWSEWFAWFPVMTVDHRRVWLEWVERRCNSHGPDCPMCGCSLEYRTKATF
jgi:hypothetical protein